VNLDLKIGKLQLENHGITFKPAHQNDLKSHSVIPLDGTSKIEKETLTKTSTMLLDNPS